MALALAGLAVRILLKPKGSFPDTHVGHNKEMRKRGIACAKLTDTGCSPSVNQAICETCGEKID